MADNRFVETVCEILGIRSPSDIKFGELKKLLKEHFHDVYDEDYFETEASLIYRVVFDSEEEENDG